MKKIISIFVLLLAAATAFGQQAQPLPNDPAVRVGKLDNGLTYYIRHNDKPEGRAEFYLATNVGAIQETPDQDGLAHFLEHMCFNGTQNLPGKQMLEYLQKIGAEFGRNINAGTGVEQTTYMLNNMPVHREGIVDTCLLIMHDYSHFVTLDPEEIDKERGVIIEEKRQRNNAQWRMFEKSLPYLYGDSKYATCTLIGSQENLETFKPESLVNFYKTWYRPDLQAVIVVGDIDVDQIEAKIKTVFADIPAPVDPQPKEMPVLPVNEEPVIGIISDPEATSSSVEVIWKTEKTPEELNNTDMGFFLNMIEDYVYYIMDERFNDITSKPGAPFIGASFGIGGFVETSDAVFGDVSCKDGENIEAFKAFLTEVEKMKRYGFSQGEVDRAKERILQRYQRAVEAADTRRNAEFVNLYIDNFFDNEPFAEPEVAYEIAQQFASMINADLLNQVVAQIIPDNNMIIISQAPEKDGLVQPTEAEFLAAIAEVKDAEIQANVEEHTGEPLLDPASLKGSKVKKTGTTVYGATEWTLKNGVKVVVFPTDYKKDQVMIRLVKDGGTSLIATEDLPSFEDNIFNLFLRNSGLSKFSKSTLDKMLAGNTASASFYCGSARHGISASSAPKDLETALQLLYLTFTQPRFDADEWQVGIDQIKAILPNLVSQPNYAFQREYLEAFYGDNPRGNILISEEVLEKASLETYERVYRELFKDATGAVVYVVGNVDMATLKPLAEKYIGSLPTGKTPTAYDTHNMLSIRKGKITNRFAVPMQTPMNTVLQLWSADIPYSVENEVLYDAVAYILDMIYVDTLREEEGGTYGASASCVPFRIPEERVVLQVYFNTNPQQSDRLRELAVEAVTKLASEGPTEEYVTRTVENFRKNLPESRISNSYWLSNIMNWYNYSGEDYDAEYEAALSKITVESVKAAAKAFVDGGNFIEVVMTPTAE